MSYIDVLLNGITRFISEGTAYHKIKSISAYGLNLKRDSPIYSRMAVLDVIFDPNDITKNIEDYHAHYSGMGVSNLDYLSVLPRNSIVANPIGETGSSVPMFLLPFFPPHFAMPVKPGEQVWVFFEDDSTKIGYWVSRVNDFQHVDDVNHTHPPRLFDKSMLNPSAAEQSSTKAEYEFRNGVVAMTIDDERYTLPETAYLPGGDDSFERLLTLTRSSKMIDYESVPRFRKRPPDFAFEGSNNQLIAMTTDRSGPVAEYDDLGNEYSVKIPEEDKRGESGTIDVVVGRGMTSKTSGKKVTNSLDREEIGKSLPQTTSHEGDPDLKNDKSRLIIVQKSGKLLDERMNTEVAAYVERTRVANSQISEDSETDETVDFSGAAIKSDKVRIMARSDIVIVSTNYEIDENGNVIDIENIEELASVVIRPGGDIIIKPGAGGVVKIGGEDADRAILCTSEPIDVEDGEVSYPGTMVSTMGGHIGTNASSQGTFSSKILVKARS